MFDITFFHYYFSFSDSVDVCRRGLDIYHFFYFHLLHRKTRTRNGEISSGKVAKVQRQDKSQEVGKTEDMARKKFFFERIMPSLRRAEWYGWLGKSIVFTFLLLPKLITQILARPKIKTECDRSRLFGFYKRWKQISIAIQSNRWYISIEHVIKKFRFLFQVWRVLTYVKYKKIRGYENKKKLLSHIYISCLTQPEGTPKKWFNPKRTAH